jgi:hypothetical protein
MMENINLNMDSLSKELLLILEILKCKENTNVKRIIKENNDIDWKLFFELIMHHRVYPTIATKIKKIGPDLIPLNVIQTITSSYKKNTFKMLHLSGEMEQLSKIFEESKIHLIFLKGPILAKELYGDVSLRTCGDLDVLIPIKDLEAADQLLVNMGYVKDDYIQTVLNDWKWRHHHVTYKHPLKNIKIEIHWRLHPGPGIEPKFTDLWGRKRVSSLTNHPVYILGREDLFLFLVVHGARHGWSRLRWLVDIQQMLNQGINWLEVNKLSERQGHVHVVGQSIVLAAQLLNSNINNNMQPLLMSKSSRLLAQEALFYLEKMINLHTDPVPVDISLYHVRHLYSLMSKQQKVLYKLSFLFPFPADAQTLPLPKRLHFLYFLLRPFLWFWRKARNHAIS